MPRIRALTFGIAGAAAALYFLYVRFLDAGDTLLDVPWWMLAPLFFFVETFVVHFELRRHAHSFTLSEIPLVLGLFLASPGALLAAQLCGVGLGLLRRRQSPLKYLFNFANVWLSSTAAIIVFNFVQGSAPDLSGASLAATFAATLVGSLLGILGVVLAISLSGGESNKGFWKSSFLLGLAVTLSNTSVGIIAVAVVSFRPALAWVLVVPCLALFLAYRTYTSQREKHQSLQALYESSRMLHHTMDGERAMSEIMEQARTMFKAEVAEMVLFAAKPEEVHVRARLGPDDQLTIERIQELGVTDSLASRVALEDTSLLISSTSADAILREALRSRGLHDVITTALHGNQGVIGTILVGNRLGDVSTFRAKDLKLLETMANNISAALENIRLADRLRSEAAERRYQALHDGLTGLPNRALLHEHLSEVLHGARQTGHLVAVLLMDLDGFREVNDTLGHHNGDKLLQQVALRVQDTLKAEEIVARLGGDEFAVLLPAIASPDEAHVTANDILNRVQHAFVVDGVAVEVRASVGIAISPTHGEDPNLLMQRADVAMYLAKDAHSGFEIYAAERDRYSATRLSLAAELRRAIDVGEIAVNYQPKARLADGSICGAEALARWNHPELGIIPPDEFIPIAEQTGLVKPLTLYVIDRVLRQIAEWRAEGLDMVVSVNLSARNLLDLELPGQVSGLLSRWAVPSSKLVLEITESFIMADPVRAKAVLDRLSEMGVSLAIDDFGTGYSSLAYLKRLPIQELKIDKSFVTHMLQDDSDAAIVRSTIELGHNLGLSLVAEGVETQALWDELWSLRCDIAQGYFLSAALPAEEFRAWIRARVAEDAIPPRYPVPART